jgi:hypothetical protein
MAALVEPFGVRCVNASRLSARDRSERGGGGGSMSGWALKPLAILHSAFREVIFLDADNVPVRDPEYLFETPEFRERGAIFWPDRPIVTVRRDLWELLGIPFREEREFESGQMVIDKSRGAHALRVALWMNERAEFFYRFLYGDKDTFRLAWHAAGLLFAMPEAEATDLLVQKGGPFGVLCQHDFDGERLFQHRGFPKWQLHGDNPRVPGFLFEGCCRQFLDELRTAWDGRIEGRRFGAQAESAGPADQFTTDLTGEPFWLEDERAWEESETTTHDGEAVKCAARPRSRELRFGRDGLITLGACPDFYFWRAVGDADNQWLELFVETAAKVRLERRTGETMWTGAWRGRDAHVRGVAMRTSLQPLRQRFPMMIPPYVVRVASVGQAFSSPFKVGQASSLQSDAPQAFRSPFKVGQASSLPSAAPQASSLRSGSQGRLEARPADRAELSQRLRDKFGAKAALSLNPAGLGDSAVAVYASSALAQCGIDVTLHTSQANWLSRVCQPCLTITDAPAPADATPLYRDYDGHLRYAGSRAYWMSGSIDLDLVPCRPAGIDRTITCDRLGFDRYVLLAPFAMWKTREWPMTHWIRLTHLLSESGYDVIALGSHLDADRIAATFNKTYAFWAAQQEPGWITDVMLGAEAVIGNDSGLTHLAGLLDVPTIALHAHLPPEVLWDCTNVVSLAPQTACTFCRWQSWRGFREPCDDACSALSTIGPEVVMQAVRLMRRARSGGVGAARTRGPVPTSDSE